MYKGYLSSAVGTELVAVKTLKGMNKSFNIIFIDESEKKIDNAIMGNMDILERLGSLVWPLLTDVLTSFYT